ncbi:MAG: hypothetical protein ACYS0H_30830 [Planctomycetota bacterium]|jgi:hypothetical protein
MKKLLISMILVCLVPAYVQADVYVDDFSGDLSQWTAGPSHLNSHGIVGDQSFVDGYGHLADPGNGGWDVLQFDQQLGSNFVATWDARTTHYDYANFTLSDDSPWAFNSSLGYIDTNDPEFVDSHYKFGLRFGEDSQGYVDNSQVRVVPTPGSVLLGLFGLGVVGMKLRKYA